MISISKIRALFSRKHVERVPEPLRMERVWSVELMVIISLLVVILGFDIWVYEKLATPGGTPDSNQTSGVTALDKKDIISLTKSFQENENFLKDPTLPLIGSPF